MFVVALADGEAERGARVGRDAVDASSTSTSMPASRSRSTAAPASVAKRDLALVASTASISAASELATVS